jgi:hypothetical protein
LARRAEKLVGEAQVRIGQIRAANASKTPKADLPGTAPTRLFRMPKWRPRPKRSPPKPERSWKN